MAEPSGTVRTDLILPILNSNGVEVRSDSDASFVEEPFPKPGRKFLDFQLIEEVGRGAFGRVFLATQGNLSSRPVALKVARDMFGETQTLAQLQHASIVQIYSYHKVGTLQAICMPFLGRTTLADVMLGLRGGTNLPRTGRELKSTIDRLAHETAHGDSSTFDTNRAPAQGIRTEDVTTWDGWLRYEGLSYVDTVLSIGARLAEGLSHAHRRGILHRDLKPANILLTDDGLPMLLDFNLAEDTKVRTATDRAAVGGTLPYMAPEQLRILLDRTGVLDPRADLFALGVILYELITGRHPYSIHHGRPRDIVGAMLMDRMETLTSPAAVNKAVSPATAAIIMRLLAPDPDDRYSDAESLRDDIERQLSNRPLKHASNPSIRERAAKWTRRHPRISSSGSVGILASLLLIGVGTAAYFSSEQARTLGARARFSDHRSNFADVQLFLDDRNQSRGRSVEGLDRLNAVLERFGVSDDDGWIRTETVRRLPESERDQLRADIGESYFRMAEIACVEALSQADRATRADWIGKAEAWNAVADRLAGNRIPTAVRSQRTTLAGLRGVTQAGSTPPVGSISARDLALTGGQLARIGQYREALAALRRATQLDPTDFSAWFVRGSVHLTLEQNELAAMSFGACLAIRPQFAPAWRNRGLAFSKLRRFELAQDDYDRAASVDPLCAETYLQRAAVRDALGKLVDAEADYSTGLALGSVPIRAYFLRADVRERKGDKAGAAADRAEGLRLVPSDELSWIGRAEWREESDPIGALADVDEALKLNALSLPGMQMKAHLLAERLSQPVEAIRVLDRAVELFPESAPARAGRGVLLARQGDHVAANRDAKDALLLDGNASNVYQVACIFALTSRTSAENKTEALRLLWASLKTGFGLDLVDSDSDLDPIRSDPEFKRLVQNAREFQFTLKKLD